MTTSGRKRFSKFLIKWLFKALKKQFLNSFMTISLFILMITVFQDLIMINWKKELLNISVICSINRTELPPSEMQALNTELSSLLMLLYAIFLKNSRISGTLTLTKHQSKKLTILLISLNKMMRRMRKTRSWKDTDQSILNSQNTSNCKKLARFTLIIKEFLDKLQLNLKHWPLTKWSRCFMNHISQKTTRAFPSTQKLLSRWWTPRKKENH